MTALQIAQLREDFIRTRSELLSKRVSAAERKLLDVVISRIVDDFEKTDGKINPSVNNVQLVARIDKVWSEFQQGEYVKVIQQFAGDLGELQNLNDRYFSIVEADNKKIAKVTKDVRSIMSKRLGIKPDGGIVKEGYLDKLLKDNTLLSKIKKDTYKAVTSGTPLRDYLKRINTTIVGTENIDGGLKKHFNTFARDTYSQYDRANQNLFANKLGLRAFIYAGGLIKTSRLFCEHNNGKVFTTDEAQIWKDTIGEEDGVMWSDAQGEYNPMEDFGGFNCRHSPNFISNREAIRRRPELAAILE